MIRRFLFAALFATVSAALFAIAIRPLAAAAATCESLASLALPDTTITSATPTEAGPFKAPGAAAAAAPLMLPAFCRVAATIKPSPESHIRIEVWMPPAGSWNGKFLGTGNGGAGGVISYAALANGLQKGYAVTNTDMGTTTTGLDFTFGIGHIDLARDWAYRATHLMTLIAKQVTKTYYDRDPNLSYFTGCSTGGHQAVTEAHRYPDDYNGIVVGDPANNRIRLHVVGTWNWIVTHEDPESYFPPAKIPMIHKAVIEACDAIDGIKDGVIDDPRTCKFDPLSLVCPSTGSGQVPSTSSGQGPSTAGGADCLTQKQAIAVKKIYQGPKNPRTGELVFPGMYPGSEANTFGFERAVAQPPSPDQKMPIPGAGLVAWAKSWKGPGFDFDKDLTAVMQELDFIDDADPNLSAFKKRGGKMIFYTGWADPLIPAQDLVTYYEGMRKLMGGADKTTDFARLFMVPGMGHCAGGDGPNRFDALGALESWVEKSVAPTQMIATHMTAGKADRTRPLCVYPQVAKWKGSGSTDEAANFVCAAP
jgi:feruloyl esterase